MASIIIRFIDSRGFVGKGITFVTASLFSHVEFGTPAGTWIGAHAGGGIQERAADYCKPSREYVYSIPCTQQQQDALLSWARSRIGTKYNLADIAGLMFHARSLNNPTRLICSEFCVDGLIRVLGAQKVLNVLLQFAYLITPETLHLSPIFVGNMIKKVG